MTKPPSLLVCERCEGEGTRPCRECDGDGDVYSVTGQGRTSIGAYYPEVTTERCPDCTGGRVPCPDCGGAGGYEP